MHRIYRAMGTGPGLNCLGCPGINPGSPDGCGCEFSTSSCSGSVSEIWSGGGAEKGKDEKTTNSFFYSESFCTVPCPEGSASPRLGPQTNLGGCREESETSHLHPSRSVQLKSSFKARPGSPLCCFYTTPGTGRALGNVSPSQIYYTGAF